MSETAPTTTPIDCSTRYAGADWLRGQGIEVSDVGAKAANLLGHLFEGLYHIDRAARRIDWSKDFVIINLAGYMSTYDDSLLTRLVIAAHDMCLRVSISAIAHGYLQLHISGREREADLYHRHPTIEAAIERHRKYR